MYSQISFDKKMLSNSEERNLKYIKKLNIYFFFLFAILHGMILV